MEPVEMYQRAATAAAELVRGVRPEQAALPTPCSEWDVRALIEHMAGGSSYLWAAIGRSPEGDERWPTAPALEEVLRSLASPGALEGRCMSPAGFEWSVAEAVAATAMDQLVHTWDLAVALGADRQLDAEVVETVAAMFLPQMPEIGRQAGLVGPEIPIAADAPVQDRLLGAMGRDPKR